MKFERKYSDMTGRQQFGRNLPAHRENPMVEMNDCFLREPVGRKFRGPHRRAQKSVIEVRNLNCVVHSSSRSGVNKIGYIYNDSLGSALDLNSFSLYRPLLDQS